MKYNLVHNLTHCIFLLAYFTKNATCKTWNLTNVQHIVIPGRKSHKSFMSLAHISCEGERLKAPVFCVCACIYSFQHLSSYIADSHDHGGLQTPVLAGSELRGRRPSRPTNHASKLNKTKPVKDLSSKTKAGMELVCADNLEGHEGLHHRDHTFHLREVWGQLSQDVYVSVQIHNCVFLEQCYKIKISNSFLQPKIANSSYLCQLFGNK